MAQAKWKDRRITPLLLASPRRLVTLDSRKNPSSETKPLTIKLLH